MRSVGVVGLGAMGRPIAERITQAGYEVVGYDTGAASTASGVRMVSALDDVATTDLVLIVVPTDEDVVAAASGIIARGHSELVIVISSSVRPQTCRDLADAAAPTGIKVLDAALTGGIRGARAGTINLLIGGDPAVAARAWPVLSTFCQGYHLLGEVGAGQVAKAASNLIHWAEIVAIDEALRLAAAFGVAPSALRAALQEGGTDSRTLRELELMHFTWYAKDIAVAEQMAATVGMSLPLAALARDLMAAVTPETIRALFAGEQTRQPASPRPAGAPGGVPGTD